MLHRFEENLIKGRCRALISSPSLRTAENVEGGWTDALLSGMVLFSHRVNDYTPTDFPEYLHSHDYFELTVCASGDSMQYITDDRYLSARPGTAILTKPNTIHMFRALDSLRYDRYVIYFRPIPALFGDPSVLDFIRAGDPGSAAFCFEAGPSVLSYAEDAERALADPTAPYAGARALLRLTELFLTLSDSRPVRAEDIASPVPEFIARIKAYIDKEFASLHSAADLSSTFFYSREYITRVFRQYYNTPLYEYILRRKLLESCSLLRAGESVEKAAAGAGFRNMSSFIKVFRKFQNCTPSEYKKRNAGG